MNHMLIVHCHCHCHWGCVLLTNVTQCVTWSLWSLLKMRGRSGLDGSVIDYDNVWNISQLFVRRSQPTKSHHASCNVWRLWLLLLRAYNRPFPKLKNSPCSKCTFHLFFITNCFQLPPPKKFNRYLCFCHYKNLHKFIDVPGWPLTN